MSGCSHIQRVTQDFASRLQVLPCTAVAAQSRSRGVVMVTHPVAKIARVPACPRARLVREDWGQTAQAKMLGFHPPFFRFSSALLHTARTHEMASLID